MGLIETIKRIPDILDANLNALLDNCEDEAKMIDKLLIDCKRDLADVKRDTVKVMADYEQSKKDLDECDEKIATKALAAQNALKAGEEDDARTIIAQKQALEETRKSLKATYDINAKNADMMKKSYNKLVSDISTLESRRDAAKAKMTTASTIKKSHKVSEKANSSAAMDKFAEYERRADRELSEAMAAVELDEATESADALTEKYTAGASTASVEDEMAKMKAELGIQ